MSKAKNLQIFYFVRIILLSDGHVYRKSDSRKIERLQERALRSVCFDKSSAYDERIVRAKLPSLLNRRLQEIAITMYKIKYNLCTRYILNFIRTFSD